MDNQGKWENVPLELLSHIYSFLSRRDRLSCSLVCSRWKDGLDHVLLWRTVIVYIDIDLMEPSTMLLLRDYCKYIRNLEFGWAVPHRNIRYAQVTYKELTKRAVRFFLVLHDNSVKLHCLRVFNWFDFVSFQKVTYHICRFLKGQMNLKKIVFDNINLHSNNFVKLLTSCLGSRSSITTLDTRSCYYCQHTFDSIYFKSCIEQLSYLRILKVDYSVLAANVIESILTSRNRSLECLELVLRERSDLWGNLSRPIEDIQWSMLCTACPNLKVTLIIRNIQHFGDLSLYLTESIPIISLSIATPRTCDTRGGCNFRKTLNLIVSLYHKTLESVDLHIKNEGEFIDDTVLMLIRRCKKMKNFIFNGYLDNPKSIKAAFPDVRCFCILPNEYPEKHLLNKLFKEDVSGMRNKRVQFTLLKRDSQTMCTLLILN